LIALFAPTVQFERCDFPIQEEARGIGRLDASGLTVSQVDLRRGGGKAHDAFDDGDLGPVLLSFEAHADSAHRGDLRSGSSQDEGIPAFRLASEPRLPALKPKESYPLAGGKPGIVRQSALRI